MLKGIEDKREKKDRLTKQKQKKDKGKENWTLRDLNATVLGIDETNSTVTGVNVAVMGIGKTYSTVTHVTTVCWEIVLKMTVAVTVRVKVEKVRVKV